MIYVIHRSQSQPVFQHIQGYKKDTAYFRQHYYAWRYKVTYLKLAYYRMSQSLPILRITQRNTQQTQTPFKCISPFFTRTEIVAFHRMQSRFASPLSNPLRDQNVDPLLPSTAIHSEDGDCNLLRNFDTSLI